VHLGFVLVLHGTSTLVRAFNTLVRPGCLTAARSEGGSGYSQKMGWTMGPLVRELNLWGLGWWAAVGACWGQVSPACWLGPDITYPGSDFRREPSSLYAAKGRPIWPCGGVVG
jgi:hypothetical protein